MLILEIVDVNINFCYDGNWSNFKCLGLVSILGD